MRMEFVSGKIVITDHRTDRMAVEGEEFMEVMGNALFSTNRYPRDPFSYIFARPRKIPLGGQNFLYSEIAKVRHDLTQMRIIWDVKEYEEHHVADYVEATWPFVVSPERDIVLRRFGETADFLETFRGIFRQLYVITGRDFTSADIKYDDDERDVLEIADAMECITAVGLKRMRRPNPVLREDYERYRRFLEEQRAMEASTEFRNEEEERGLNVGEESLLRSGLVGAEGGFGDWEVEGFVDGQKHSVRSTERILKVIRDIPMSIRDDVEKMADLMVRVLRSIRRRP